LIKQKKLLNLCKNHLHTVIYMGYSAYNIELYVSENDYKKVKELLKSLNIDAAEEFNETAQNQKTKKDVDREKRNSFYLAQIAK